MLHAITKQLEICIYNTWIFTSRIFKLALEITFLRNNFFSCNWLYDLLSQSGKLNKRGGKGGAGGCPTKSGGGWKNFCKKNIRGRRLLGIREYLFTVRLRQCSHFFKLITWTQQVLFQSSNFFRAAPFFLSYYFFRAIISSQLLLFQNGHYFITKVLPSSYLLKIGSCFRQLLFWNSYIFGAGIYSE